MWNSLTRSGVLIFSLACAITGGACQRANPAYHPDGAPGGASGSGGISGGTGGIFGGGGDLGTGGLPSGGTNGGGHGPDGGMPETGMPDGRMEGPDGTDGMCQNPIDCEAQLGAPPCGKWECKNSGTCVLNCPNCTDKDGDGYGVGAGCVGLDCDDADRQIIGGSSRACFTGPAVNKNIGVCRTGQETCIAGTWSGCNGQVLPSGEACNGEDDDCNGAVDDKLAPIACGVGVCAKQVASCAAGKPGVCVPATPAVATDGCDNLDNDCDGMVDEDCSTLACVHVAPSGDDAAADGDTKAFRNLQPAIAWAALADHPKRVCVAGGATCQDHATFVSPEAVPGLTMANGVSLFGNYEATGWTRCPLGTPQPSTGGPTVTIQTQTATGVLFPATVNTPTTLDGFAFTRSRGEGLTSSTAITVDGAKAVTLSNLLIADAPVALVTMGINLINGAQALITQSSITGGSGSTDAIAIRSAGSTPTIRENCGKLDPGTGRCVATSCTGASGLRGRETSGALTSTSTSAAVFLNDSPGAVVESNVICGGPASNLAGVRVAGTAGGTVVRGNTILADGGTVESHGVWLDACGDATPWIVDNELIAADGAAGASVSAVRALGSCHPVIDGNQRLAAGGEAATLRAIGVACGGQGATASRCAVLGNKLIQGSAGNHALASAGILCEGGACTRIAGNTVDGHAGSDSVGIAVIGGGPLIERNNILGGCGTNTTTGLRIDNGSGRVQNNLIRGAACEGNLGTTLSLGLRIYVQPGGNELDVHSNTIDGAGTGTCSGNSAAVVFGANAIAAAAGPTTKGIFRNNILSAGACKALRYGFWEDSLTAQPRLFENNDLDPTGSPTALYLKATLTPQNTAAAVNALTGTSARGNISAAPMFVAPPSDLHLGMGSACVNAGTTAGAPPADAAGKARDGKPDIGAFEQ